MLRLYAIQFCCFVTLAVMPTGRLVACQTCKDGLHNNLGVGFGLSIVFMISIPFLIIAGWTVAILRLQRHKSQVALSHTPTNERAG